MLAGSGVAAAELRVLLAFDEQGLRVARVRGNDAPEPDLARPAGSPSPVNRARAAAFGDAVLLWRDVDGRVLLTTRFPDPRLGHAPTGTSLHDATTGGRVVLDSGAWQVRGPAAATRLDVRLPMHLLPALGAEEWLLSLDQTPFR